MQINSSPINSGPLNGGLAVEPPQPDPDPPVGNGKSAYEIWLDLGNIGSEQDFIDSLKGDSAFQVWQSLGNESGTVFDYMAAIKGAPGVNGVDAVGEPGANGSPGESAYRIWLDAGNTGSEQDFLNALKGTNGKSAYQEWLDAGNLGTEQAFLEWLRQPPTGKKTTQLAVAQSITGTETLYLVQDNVSLQISLADLKAWLNS